jgi:surface antigen
MAVKTPTPTPGPNPQSVPAGTCSYPYGECTYYVASQYTVLQKTACLGNACQWWPAAQQNGWWTSQTPYVGGVMVMNCSTPGSNGDGHVAIVKTVNSDGTFVVSEMNWTAFGQIDSRTVTSMSHVLGFFSPPGAPIGGGQGGQTSPCTAPSPATGARGLTCQYPISYAGFRITIGPYTSNCMFSFSLCLDGLIGGIAFAGGLAVMVLAVVLAAKPYTDRFAGHVEQEAGRTAEVIGAATMQPEVAEAGGAVASEGERTSQRGQRARSQAGAAQSPRRRPPARPSQRRPSRDGMSVQEQETYRTLRGLGFTSVQARRGARAGGSGGDTQSRVTAALRSLGQA